MLNESDKIINDQKEVANHFNIVFSNVAENIGKDTDHPSLVEIKKQNDCTKNLFLKRYQQINKGNNKITELRTILQRESQNS